MATFHYRVKSRRYETENGEQADGEGAEFTPA
jgi:hypothetical protein